MNVAMGTSPLLLRPPPSNERNPAPQWGQTPRIAAWLSRRAFPQLEDGMAPRLSHEVLDRRAGANGIEPPERHRRRPQERRERLPQNRRGLLGAELDRFDVESPAPLRELRPAGGADVLHPARLSKGR